MNVTKQLEAFLELKKKKRNICQCTYEECLKCSQDRLFKVKAVLLAPRMARSIEGPIKDFYESECMCEEPLSNNPDKEVADVCLACDSWNEIQAIMEGKEGEG